MSRLHVHLSVRDLNESVRFYSTLFGHEPTRIERGYAKWMLDDPRANFAISEGSDHTGLSHLGIQVDSDAELASVAERAKAAAGQVLHEEGARCCYAVGNKAWAEDPQGVRWEQFHTLHDAEEFGAGAQATRVERGSDAMPAQAAGAGCCCG